MTPRMQTPFGVYILSALLALGLSDACQSKEREKIIIGWIEKVRIDPSELTFNAKVDTGARTSSINARNIVEFEEEGKTWVRFEVINKKNESVTLELPLQREAVIKRHFGKRQHRSVVLMGICLGTIFKKTEVTLVDREGFIYTMLLGRSFLEGDFLIDISKNFTIKPACQMPDNE